VSTNDGERAPRMESRRVGGVILLGADGCAVVCHASTARNLWFRLRNRCCQCWKHSPLVASLVGM